MPHRKHNCTNTLYDYAIIINTYVSLMYKLKKKMERYWRLNLLGPGPRLMKTQFTGPRSHKSWETLTLDTDSVVKQTTCKQTTQNLYHDNL